MEEQIIRITKLSTASQFNSLRTVIPNELVKEYDLKAGDRVLWKKIIYEENGKKHEWIVIEFQHQ